MCVFIFSAVSVLNTLGAFLNVVTWLTLFMLDLVFYLCVLVFPTLVSLFGVFAASGITRGCAPVIN